MFYIMKRCWNMQSRVETPKAPKCIGTKPGNGITTVGVSKTFKKPLVDSPHQTSPIPIMLLMSVLSLKIIYHCISNRYKLTVNQEKKYASTEVSIHPAKVLTVQCHMFNF